MPPRYWCSACRKVSWLQRLFGAMPKPSTARRGVARWIASLRATPASLGPLPESAKEPMTLGIFGQLSYGSSKSARRRASSSRMLQTTLFTDLQTSEQIYGDWVTGLKLAYLARQRSALRTGENDSSRWPTMTVFGNNNRTGSSESSGNGLATIARDWPTPAVAQAKQGQNDYDGHRGQTLIGAARGQEWATPRASMTTGPFVHEKSGQDLQTMATFWPTPMTPSGGRVNSAEEVAAKGSTEKGKRTISLESVSKYWMTPIASEAKHGSPNQKFHDGAPGLSAQAIGQWNTPTTTDHRKASPAAADRIAAGTAHTSDLRLREQAASICLPFPPALTPDSNGKESSTSTRRLNPLFVEFLMGVPRGWTSCAPLEMASFQSWRRTHFALLQICLRRGNEA